MSFKKILELCEKRGFLKQTITGGDSSNNNSFWKLGPVGALLEENLKNEWILNMVVNSDNNIFLSKDSFSNTFNYVKEICNDKIPFGIAELVYEKSNARDTNESSSESYEDLQFKEYFLPNTDCILQTTLFVSPADAMQVYHQRQRLRKVWWRKFSANPGRYKLTDVQTESDGSTSIAISSNYSWGSQIIEVLRLSTSSHSFLSSNDLQVKDGRKTVQANFITSEISLNSMVLNAICDAYDESPFQDRPRPSFRLHRRLAPYKISFAGIASESGNKTELYELAQYLCRKLKANHISSLLLPNATRTALNAQWCHYDELGIPYAVCLNDNTLKNGICLLRSRDTTLKEEVHISKLPTYVEQLFKNY